jgi:arylsulfatase A-like enzyme
MTRVTSLLLAAVSAAAVDAAGAPPAAANDAAAAAPTAAVSKAAASPPPSIIFILADDLGWHDVGFSGSGIETPNIDALLANGVRLSEFYGQPVCTPSRTAITTGRFPIAYGMQSYVLDPTGVDYGLNLNETTLASVLRDRGGYSTVHVGKHHMGEARWEQTPTFRGFNFFHGYYSGGQDYFTHKEQGAIDFRIDAGRECGANCSVVDWDSVGVYSANVYGASAVAQIAKHAAAYPDGSKPLFMYLATQSVHAPAQVPPHYIPSPCPWSATRCTFAGMIRALDELVGNVTDALAAAGMADNTLIVFVADNGGPTVDDGGGDAIGSTNWPLRGGKHGVFEGGVRLTAVVSGPLVVPPAGVPRGGNLTGLVHHVDWFPTLLEAAGVTDYTPAPGFELHGSSAWGMLTRGEPSPRTEVLLNIDPCVVGSGSGRGWGRAQAPCRQRRV